MLTKSIPALPGYDWASSSRKEVPRIGISCISQVQLPWGRLPGSGQVFPEHKVYKSILVQERVQKRLDFYLWGSLSTNRLLSYSLCRLGGSSSLYSARQGTLNAGTIWKHWRVLLLLHNLVLLQSGWFPAQRFPAQRFPAQRISHSLRYSFPRDKVRLPRLSSFLHSWLLVRRWPARLCCLNDSN